MEQAIIVSVPLSDNSIGTKIERSALSKLADILADQIEKLEGFDFDGDEIGEGVYKLFMYGPAVDNAFNLIRTELLQLQWPVKISLVRRYGPPGSRERHDLV